MCGNYHKWQDKFDCPQLPQLYDQISKLQFPIQYYIQYSILNLSLSLTAMTRIFTLASRGSQLAQIQTNIVLDACEQLTMNRSLV